MNKNDGKRCAAAAETMAIVKCHLRHLAMLRVQACCVCCDFELILQQH